MNSYSNVIVYLILSALRFIRNTTNSVLLFSLNILLITLEFYLCLKK